jgi:hypothetical protein
MKLGRHQRRLLLEAADPGGAASPILPEARHSDDVTQRRAIASLRGAGLIVVYAPGKRLLLEVDADDHLARRAPQWTDAEWAIVRLGRGLQRKSIVPRYSRRTRLGQAIVHEYEPVLREPGRPIRWDARLDRAMAAARVTCGQCG